VSKSPSGRNVKTKTIRVRPGESKQLCLHVEGAYCITGDVFEFAQALYERSYQRLLKSKSSKHRREFVEGMGVLEP
jgi:hypothetical protein